MMYDIVPETMDKLTTPIIICDKSGFVVYKNSIAVSKVRLPKRGTDMKTHIDEGGKRELSTVWERTKPCVITVHTGDRNAKALVTSVEYNGNECSLWVFVSVLQANASSRLFSLLENDLSMAGKDICGIICNVYESSKLPLNSNNALHNRIERSFERVLSTVLDTKNDAAYWSVSECASILKHQLDGAFRDFGFDADFESDNLMSHMGLYIDFRDFFIFYIHVISFCCELSRNRHIKLRMNGNDDSTIDFEVRFTMMFPEFFAVDEDDLSRLIKFAPLHKVDFAIFEKLCKVCGYRIHYSVTEDHFENVVFKFTIPTIQKHRFSSPRDIEREKAFIDIDADILLRYILEFSLFDPDRENVCEN